MHNVNKHVVTTEMTAEMTAVRAQTEMRTEMTAVGAGGPVSMTCFGRQQTCHALTIQLAVRE